MEWQICPESIELLGEHLVSKESAFDLGEQAAAQAKAAKQRAWCKAVYDCFEASEDGVHYRCNAGNIAWGTPCGTTLRIRGAGKASKLSNHHSAATQENTEL